MNTPTCEAPFATARLLLTPLDDGDLEAIFRLYASEEVSRGFGQDRLCDIAQARYWLDVQRWSRSCGSGASWCLRLKDDGEVIGSIGFDCINRLWHNAAISYALLPSCWGRGLMSEALGGLAAQAFAGALGCPIHRIEALVLPGNPRSVRVLDKNGFQPEGRRRGLVYWQGGYRDVDSFALLNPAS
jgi:ribosomal-protein-alanine N-acetyltransferase